MPPFRDNDDETDISAHYIGCTLWHIRYRLYILHKIISGNRTCFMLIYLIFTTLNGYINLVYVAVSLELMHKIWKNIIVW